MTKTTEGNLHNFSTNGPQRKTTACFSTALFIFFGLLCNPLANVWADKQNGGEEKKATVHVRTSKPGVTISTVTGHGVGVSSSGHTAAATYFEDICKAPCSFEVEPGLVELAITRGGPGAANQMQLVSGENFVSAKPGSTAGFWGGYAIASVGFVAALYGGIGWAVSGSSRSNVGLTLGGLGGIAGGYGLMRYSRSTIELESAPAPPINRSPVFSYRGTF